MLSSAMRQEVATWVLATYILRPMYLAGTWDRAMKGLTCSFCDWCAAGVAHLRRVRLDEPRADPTAAE
jgi:hypothetical protein